MAKYQKIRRRYKMSFGIWTSDFGGKWKSRIICVLSANEN